MPSLADAPTRDRIAERIAVLTPASAAQWGRMSSAQMLAHCADALRMAYGELDCAPKRVPLARLGIVKWLALNVLPFPKSAPTARELIARQPARWEEERDALQELVARFGRETNRSGWPAHPLFGDLTGAQCGQLAWKHLDHHLRQFGV